MKNERIVRACAFCVNACLLPTSDATEASPLLFALTSDAFDEESVHLSCPYKKNATPEFSCRRFRFDPLKYRPKKAPPMPLLDDDAILLD